MFLYRQPVELRVHSLVSAGLFPYLGGLDWPCHTRHTGQTVIRNVLPVPWLVPDAPNDHRHSRGNKAAFLSDPKTSVKIVVGHIVSSALCLSNRRRTSAGFAGAPDGCPADDEEEEEQAGCPMFCASAFCLLHASVSYS